jgi:hypothetical protein
MAGSADSDETKRRNDDAEKENTERRKFMVDSSTNHESHATHKSREHHPPTAENGEPNFDGRATEGSEGMGVWGG